MRSVICGDYVSAVMMMMEKKPKFGNITDIMASRPERVFSTSEPTYKGFLSKAARRDVRQAAALADELDLYSFENPPFPNAYTIAM